MKIFLSYSRLDRVQVNALADELDQRRISYWRDQRDLPVAYAWDEEAENGIRGASIVVICFSPNWEASPACVSEFRMAEEMHKQILTVWIRQASTAEVTATVIDAVGALREVDRNHAELLVRARTWVHDGRQRSTLISREVLQRLERVEYAGRPIPPEAREFLANSQSALRRRTKWRTLGILLVVALFGLAQLVQAFSKRADELLTEETVALRSVTEAHLLTLGNPYAGMQHAADVVRGGHANVIGVRALVEALDIPVPAESTVLSGAPLTEFVGGPDGELALVAASGSVLDVHGTQLAVGTSRTAAEPGATRWSGVTVQARGPGLVASGTASGAVVIRPDPRGSRSGQVMTIQPDDSGEAVSGVALDASTDTVAVAHAESNAVTVYDDGSGLLRERITVGAPVRGIAMSPDGRTVAAAVGQRVIVADLLTGRVVAELRGQAEPTRAVAWSADGASIWAINGEHRVSRWLWRGGTRLADDREAWFVGLSGAAVDGSVFAVTRTGDVHRLGPTGDRVIARTGLTVLSAGFDASAKHALLATTDGPIALQDLSTGARRVVDDGHDCNAFTPTFVSDTTAVVACYGGPLRRIDLGVGGRSRDLAIPLGGSGAVGAARDGSLFVGALSGALFRTTTELTAPENIGPPSGLTTWRTVTVSADGRTLLLTGNGTGKIGHTYIGKSDGGAWTWYTTDLPGDTSEQSRAAALSPDGRIAAIGMASGKVHIVAAQIDALGLSYSELSGAVTGIVFAPGRLLVATRGGLVEAMDPCDHCDSRDALVELADRRLATGRALGLASK